MGGKKEVKTLEQIGYEKLFENKNLALWQKEDKSTTRQLSILKKSKGYQLVEAVSKYIDGEISVKVELVADKDITEEERLAFNFAAEGV